MAICQNFIRQRMAVYGIISYYICWPGSTLTGQTFILTIYCTLLKAFTSGKISQHWWLWFSMDPSFTRNMTQIWKLMHQITYFKTSFLCHSLRESWLHIASKSVYVHLMIGNYAWSTSLKHYGTKSRQCIFYFYRKKIYFLWIS